jgi:hypothetical protein
MMKIQARGTTQENVTPNFSLSNPESMSNRSALTGQVPQTTPPAGVLDMAPTQGIAAEPIPAQRPEAETPLRSIVTDTQPAASPALRVYRAKGFIIRVDGEDGAVISKDDGSHPDAEKWQNGSIIVLRFANSTLFLPLVVSTEQPQPETEPEVTSAPEAALEASEPIGALTVGTDVQDAS